MLNCSILTPAFSINAFDYPSIVSQCAENLGIETSDFELYALVPFREVVNPKTAVLKLNHSDFSLNKIEDLISQREQIYQQLQKLREALSLYSERPQEKKEPIVDEKVNRKINKLEEDNKKLRQLLK